MFRTLRTYRRIAQKDHQCDRCQQTIHAGDEYEAEVEVRRRRGERKNRLNIWKQHINPDCDYPEFPDDDRKFDDEEEDIDLPMAA